MLRRIALSLSLLVAVVVLLPFATSTAHNLRAHLSSRSHRFHHHSRAWWRRHRARLRRRQAIIARRRALQAMQAMQMASANQVMPSSETKAVGNHVALPDALSFPEDVYRDGAFVTPLPDSWSAANTNAGSSTFRIASPNGGPDAQAALAVLAAAPPKSFQPLPNELKKMVGGVTFTDLRRSVIDKMITAGGWVVNDRQREIGGHRVFEVVAQTPATSDGKSEQVWNYYFTEVNGRVYSLATRSVNAANPKVSADAEQFLSNFRSAEPKR